MVVPEKVFFTRGCGVHKDKLVSFEMALRDAGLAPYNLVTVSSIMPPDAEIISREEGLPYLSPGEIVYCVMARTETNIPGQAVAASVGLAVPEIHGKQHGYLSEYHAADISGHECGKIIKTSHLAASAICGDDGKWTTVIVAAVFILP